MDEIGESRFPLEIFFEDFDESDEVKLEENALETNTGDVESNSTEEKQCGEFSLREEIICHKNNNFDKEEKKIKNMMNKIKTMTKEKLILKYVLK